MEKEYSNVLPILLIERLKHTAYTAFSLYLLFLVHPDLFKNVKI